MFEIDCDNCGSELIPDQFSTINEYLKDADYRVDGSGKIVEETLQQYLVYRCPHCDNIYKYTYKEWEVKQRRLTAEYVMEIRKQQMFRGQINPQTLSADNGMEFCGQCSGYGGDGNCLVDVIKQCTIRKLNV